MKKIVYTLTEEEKATMYTFKEDTSYMRRNNNMTKKITLFIESDEPDVLEEVVKWVEYYGYPITAGFEEPEIKPELKIHEISRLRNGNEMTHMTFTTEEKVNYNIWTETRDRVVMRIDISQPYKG